MSTMHTLTSELIILISGYLEVTEVYYLLRVYHNDERVKWAILTGFVKAHNTPKEEPLQDPILPHQVPFLVENNLVTIGPYSHLDMISYRVHAELKNKLESIINEDKVDYFPYQMVINCWAKLIEQGRITINNLHFQFDKVTGSTMSALCNLIRAVEQYSPKRGVVLCNSARIGLITSIKYGYNPLKIYIKSKDFGCFYMQQMNEMIKWERININFDLPSARHKLELNCDFHNTETLTITAHSVVIKEPIHVRNIQIISNFVTGLPYLRGHTLVLSYTALTSQDIVCLQSGFKQIDIHFCYCCFTRHDHRYDHVTYDINCVYGRAVGRPPGMTYMGTVAGGTYGSMVAAMAAVYGTH